MSVSNYWKLRFAAAQREQALQDLHAKAKIVQETFAAMLRAEGLDPDLSYQFNDSDETVVVALQNDATEVSNGVA